jgi:Zn finger protein HypA/HybF involved in hydrogenase expression
MEIFKYDKETRVTRVPPPAVWCEKCDRPMAPLLYSSGMCCPANKEPMGMINYKCPGCGKSVDVQHRHTL